jgi:hypothetical protein
MTRLAIVHSFPGRSEEESARHILDAARDLGLEAAVMHRAEEIEAFAPDLVLCMSHHEGRLTRHPTYGVVMVPLVWLVHDAACIDRILSYDGHLTLSGDIEAWLADLLTRAGRRPRIGRYTNSVRPTRWSAPRLDDPRLAYVGTNWDGWRHWQLFEDLAARGFVRFFGPPDGWRHVDPALYGGPIPFDGTSILGVYHDAGVGLALDRQDFVEGDVPSLRIFEIVASGAVAIAADMPFVRDHFADSVLYVDGIAAPSVIAGQIAAHMAWIAADPAAATAMSRDAHARLQATLTLDRLLPRVLALHAAVRADGGPERGALRPLPPPPPHVRRLEVADDLLDGPGPVIAPDGTAAVAAVVRPFGRDAVLEIHVAGGRGDGPPVTVSVGGGPAGSGAWRTVGGLDRLRLPVDPAATAGRLEIALRASPGGPVRIEGLVLRQTHVAPVERVADLPAGATVWIVGAAAGGRRLAAVLETLPDVRFAGFLDDVVAGPLLGRPVVRLDVAARHVGPRDRLIFATQHWPSLWSRLADLPVAAVHTAHPGDGYEIVHLPTGSRTS